MCNDLNCIHINLDIHFPMHFKFTNKHMTEFDRKKQRLIPSIPEQVGVTFVSVGLL